MNETQSLSFIHKAKLVSLASYGWKMNDRHIIAVIGTIIMVSLLIAYVIPAFGSSQEAMSKSSIKQISKTKIDSSYLYLYEYCHSKNSPGVIGFLVISNVENVPVLISPNIKSGECQTYGAKIHTDESNFVKTKLFTNNELPNLIQSFENKKMTLGDNLVTEQQKLNTFYKTNASNEKIVEQVAKIEFLKELIKSARSSIILLKSVG
jgi:hypothetical protein